MSNEEYEQAIQTELAKLPIEFRSAVSWEAYDRGHSAGISEVHLHTCSLVAMLEKPCKELVQRITKEAADVFLGEQ